MKKVALAPALIVTALLAGCGGSANTTSAPQTVSSNSGTSASSAPTSSAPTAAPSTTASATASPSTSASSTPSSASSTAIGQSAADICGLLPLNQVNELAGTSYAVATRTTYSCSYQTKAGKAAGNAAGLLAGARASTKSLASIVASEKEGLGSATSRSVEIDGADDAIVVTGTDKGVPVASVVTKKNGLLYVVLIEGDVSSSKATGGVTKVMAAFLAAS